MKLCVPDDGISPTFQSTGSYIHILIETHDLTACEILNLNPYCPAIYRGEPLHKVTAEWLETLDETAKAEAEDWVKKTVILEPWQVTAVAWLKLSDSHSPWRQEYRYLRSKHVSRKYHD